MGVIQKKSLLAAGTAVAAAGAAFFARSEYERDCLEATHYTIRSTKLTEGPRTFVFLSDLHDKEFGPGNRRLLKMIRQVNPDAVLIGGDMMVAKGVGDTAVALRLIEGLASGWPVYYVNGNHECRMRQEIYHYGKKYQKYQKELKRLGVHMISNDGLRLAEDLTLYGLDLPAECYYVGTPQLKPGYLSKTLGTAGETFNLLLAHSPLYFKEYAAWGADLTLSGHFHGGTIRLPFFGGVMTPQYQFFFPWCAGLVTGRKSWRQKEGKTLENEPGMIVSRGLGTHSINIRFNNKPQIVVLHLE